MNSGTHKYQTLITFSVLGGVVVGLVTTPHKGLATFAFLLLTSGLILRKDRLKHASFMTGAIVTDLALVIFLQLMRDAVGTAVGGDLSGMQIAHVVASTLAVICYLPAMTLGFGMLNGHISAKRWRKPHIAIGLLAYCFRTIGFILMFSHPNPI